MITPILLASGYLLLRKKGKGGGTPYVGMKVGGGGGPIAVDRLLGLSHAADRPAIDANRLEFIKGAVEGWRGSGLTVTEQLALLALAWREGGFAPSVRSAKGLADDKKGGSFTSWQLRRDLELAAALRSLGLSFDQVVPPQGTTGQAIRPYAANQALAALHLARQNGLEKLRLQHAGNDELFLLDLATKWAAGVSRSWAWVLAQPGPKSILGGGRIPDDPAGLEAARTQLHDAKMQIAAGVLGKLQAYRALKRRLFG